MSYQPVFQISLTLDTINWTPLVMPKGVNSLYVLNPAGNPSVKRRTTAGDPLTELNIDPGQFEGFMISHSNDQTKRFGAGLPVAFFQSSSGAPSVKAVGVLT